MLLKTALLAVVVLVDHSAQASGQYIADAWKPFLGKYQVITYDGTTPPASDSSASINEPGAIDWGVTDLNGNPIPTADALIRSSDMVAYTDRGTVTTLSNGFEYTYQGEIEIGGSPIWESIDFTVTWLPNGNVSFHGAAMDSQQSPPPALPPDSYLDAELAPISVR